VIFIFSKNKKDPREANLFYLSRWKFSEAFLLLHVGKTVVEGLRPVLPEAGVGVGGRGRGETVPVARLVADEVEAQDGIEVRGAPQPGDWEQAVIVVVDDTAAAVGSGVAAAAVELVAPLAERIGSQAGWDVAAAELAWFRVAPVALAAEQAWSEVG
jgi:hypothetical protein